MRRADLVPDCGSCDALCCVATSFDASDDFAISKAAGVPCPHLALDHCCTIHAGLRDRGFLGCAIYDCYGAGPKITRAFAVVGSSRLQRDQAFRALRVVQELLWQLLEASKLCPTTAGALETELAHELARLEELAQTTPARLLATELAPRESAARSLLRRVGQALRGRSGRALPVLSAVGAAACESIRDLSDPEQP